MMGMEGHQRIGTYSVLVRASQYDTTRHGVGGALDTPTYLPTLYSVPRYPVSLFGVTTDVHRWGKLEEEPLHR